LPGIVFLVLFCIGHVVVRLILNVSQFFVGGLFVLGHLFIFVLRWLIFVVRHQLIFGRLFTLFIIRWLIFVICRQPQRQFQSSTFEQCCIIQFQRSFKYSLHRRTGFVQQCFARCLIFVICGRF
jgi:hypothetical protein